MQLKASSTAGPQNAPASSPSSAKSLSNKISGTETALPGHELVKALFVVTGPSDAGMLPRVVETIAKLGQVPTRVHASSESGDGSEMTVDLRLSRLPATTAARIDSALRSIIGLRQVFAVIEPAS